MAAVNKLDLHLPDYRVSVPVDLSRVPAVSDEVQALFSCIFMAPPPNINDDARIVEKRQIRNITQQIAAHQTSYGRMVLPIMLLTVKVICAAICIFFLIAPFTSLGIPLWLGILCALYHHAFQIGMSTMLLVQFPSNINIGGIPQNSSIAQSRDLQEGLRVFNPNLRNRQQRCSYGLHLLLTPFFFYLEFVRILRCNWNKVLRHQDIAIKEQIQTLLLESVSYYTSYSDELKDILGGFEDEHRDLALQQLETVSLYYTDLLKQLRNKVLPLVTDKKRVPRFHPGVDGLILEYALF